MSGHTIAAVLIASAGLALSSAPSAMAADLCSAARFQCNGFEPNWQATTTVDRQGRTVVRFIDPENPNWQTEPFVVSGCLRQGSPNDFELTTDEPLSLVANIVGQRCIEPNEDVTDYSVTVTFNQGALGSSPARVEGTGCCEQLD